MSETSNPFRRPLVERKILQQPVDEKMIESVFGAFDPAATSPPESEEPRASSEVSLHGVAADKKLKHKAPPPPPAPRRRTKSTRNAENVTPTSTRLTTPGTSTASSSLDNTLLENDLTTSQKEGPRHGVLEESEADGTNNAVEKFSISHEVETPESMVNALGISAELDGSKSPDSPLAEAVPISPSGFQTPRTSVDSVRLDPHDTSSPKGTQSPARNKPLPPTPRSRSGTKLSIPPISSASPPPSISPSISRSSSLRIKGLHQVDISEPENQASPLSPSESQPEAEKRKPPPPPISRRVSVRAPAPTGESKARPKSLLPPPPPPPIRRNKSTSSRSSWYGGQPLNERPSTPSTPHTPHTPLPLPPTPPRPKRPQSMINSHGSVTLPRLPSYVEEPEKIDEAGPDILDDLQALQREVDELRGKFQVVPEEVSTQALTDNQR